MCAGRVKRCHGLRLVLLVTVVHIPAADAKSGSQENVILIVAVISFIFLTSLAYFTVSCGYYYCVYKNQITGKESGSREDIVHPNLSVSVSSYGVSVLDGNDGPDKTVMGDRTLHDNSHPELQDARLQKGLSRQEKREEGKAPLREGLGPSDLDPEVLHQPVHVEVIDYGTSRADSGAESAPPMPQLRPRQPPGYAKSTSPNLESVLGEAQDPTRCCTVWDMCSSGWSPSEGLPPASAIPGPPSEPRAPLTIPRGRLQL